MASINFDVGTSAPVPMWPLYDDSSITNTLSIWASIPAVYLQSTVNIHVRNAMPCACINTRRCAICPCPGECICLKGGGGLLWCCSMMSKSGFVETLALGPGVENEGNNETGDGQQGHPTVYSNTKRDIPVETENFAENQNEDHANEDARLLKVGTDALVTNIAYAVTGGETGHADRDAACKMHEAPARKHIRLGAE